MTESPKKNIFKLNPNKELSTLELWQAHLKALRRASKERHNLAKNGKPIEASEITTSEVSIRPPQQ